MNNAYFAFEMLRKQTVDAIGGLVPPRSAPICN